MISGINKALTSTLMQKFINQNKIGRGLGHLADNSKIPKFLLKKVIDAYIKNYKIDMEEYDYDIDSAHCFNEFFSRPLKPNRRPISPGITSPVDGQIMQHGKLLKGQMLQIKGKTFSINDLVGEETSFQDGHYSVVYLAPGDYHRFHAPFDLQLEKIHYIPGNLLATSLESLEREERIYCRNERIILSGASAWGDFFIVAVGATAVGRVCLSHAEIRTNQKFYKELVITDGLPKSILQGEELGYFQLGSTIVLAVHNESITSSQQRVLSSIKMGETLWS